jgi:hypothetical protein
MTAPQTFPDGEITIGQFGRHVVIDRGLPCFEDRRYIAATLTDDGTGFYLGAPYVEMSDALDDMHRRAK